MASTLEKLNKNEKELIIAAFKSILKQFDDDLQTRIGADKNEIEHLLENLDKIKLNNFIVHNCLNEIVNGLSDSDIADFLVKYNRKDAERILNKLH